jgi:hypothetical protein
MPLQSTDKAIEILTGRRTRKTIAIGWRQGESHFDLDERDNPIPALVNALDALNAVAVEVLHVPASWCETNFRVIGVTFGDQGGAGTFSLVCRKGFEDASKEFAFATPPRLLAHPVEPGSYTPPVSPESVAAIEEAREQFKCYVIGERAQGVIQFEEDEDAEDDGSYSPEEPLIKFAPDEPAAVEEPVKKKRGRKPKAEASAGK